MVADARERETIEVRAATPEDDAAVLGLLQASMGWVPDEQYARFFAWKHRENPFGVSPAWVAVDGDQVVGFRTFLRWRFERDGTTVEAVRAVDTATHPDHQGRGIFSLLTRHALEQLAEDGVAFVFNTPNDNSRPGYLKMGWQLVQRLPVAARPRSPLALLRLARARVPADKWSADSSTGVPAAELFGPGGGARGVATRDEVGRIERADAVPDRPAGGAGGRDVDDGAEVGVDGASGVRGESQADAMVQRLLDRVDRARASVRGGSSSSTTGGLRTERSLAYLRWRYGFGPLHYRVVTAPDGPGDGLVVFRLRQRGAAQEAAVCEVLVPDDDPGVTRRLLGQVLRGSGADHAVLLGPARLGLGFLPVPGQGPTLVWRGVNESTPPPRDEWQLALGDIELF